MALLNTSELLLLCVYVSSMQHTEHWIRFQEITIPVLAKKVPKHRENLCLKSLVATWSQIFPLRHIFPCLLSMSWQVPCYQSYHRYSGERGGGTMQTVQPQCRTCTIYFNLCFLYISFLSCVFRSVLISLENHLSFLCLCFPISSLYCQLRVQTTQRYLTPSVEYLAQWEMKGCSNIIMEIVFEDKLLCMGNYLVCI